MNQFFCSLDPTMVILTSACMGMRKIFAQTKVYIFCACTGQESSLFSLPILRSNTIHWISVRQATVSFIKDEFFLTD